MESDVGAQENIPKQVGGYEPRDGKVSLQVLLSGLDHPGSDLIFRRDLGIHPIPDFDLQPGSALELGKEVALLKTDGPFFSPDRPDFSGQSLVESNVGHKVLAAVGIPRTLIVLEEPDHGLVKRGHIAHSRTPESAEEPVGFMAELSEDS